MPAKKAPLIRFPRFCFFLSFLLHHPIYFATFSLTLSFSGIPLSLTSNSITIMQLIHAAAASALVFSSFVAAQSGVTVNTPSSLFECSPVLLAWSGGVAPYTLRVNQAGSSSVSLETLVQSTSDTSYTWTVNQPAGMKLTIAVTDSTGATAYSGQSPDIGTGSTAW